MINVLLSLMIVISFLAAIVLHECSHALMALWLGDSTPRAEGRLTLRLRPHIDPLGTLMCVILALQPLNAMAGVYPLGLGWGQPVKPDPWKLRTGANTGVLLVACAGLVSSLLIGIVAAVIADFVSPFLINNFFTVRILQLLVVFAVVNVSLAILNLLPIYPLDGYQILYTLLPSKQAVQFSRSATYGPFIILIIFFVLPFIGQLAGISGFPLFRLGFYIWFGAVNLVGLFTGHGGLDFVLAAYSQ
ncbi:MAG TPA: site-2 protease family protein [Ktedonosporobacter sp.]|nr:site-2 protease family protein [Ktedonosporobacter sp.]